KPRVIGFSPDGLTAYVGCFGAGTYPAFEKFTFGPSSVEPDPSVIPVAFTLSQNYPNPFNPSTEIKFTLTKSGFTTLKVYNALGQEVATLVNEDLSLGAYVSHFNPSNLASGTYIYRLTTNGQTMTKKMMLMK
ncbi:MAG: T9SS type A sorting domain-containing protein, partial [bacterium]